MIPDSTMYLGPVAFHVKRAEFCPINGLGPVRWDLNIFGHCQEESDASRFPSGLMLWARGIPLPLSPHNDYTGFTLTTPVAAYPSSGQSYFAVWIDFEYETWDIKLQILEKKEDRYLLRFEALATYTIDSQWQKLTVSAWAQELRMRNEPKSDYAVWLHPGLSDEVRKRGTV